MKLALEIRSLKMKSGPREQLGFRWLVDSSVRFSASSPTVLSANPIAGPASLWEPLFGQTPNTNTRRKARSLWVWPVPRGFRQIARRKSNNGLFNLSPQVIAALRLVPQFIQRGKTFNYFREAAQCMSEKGGIGGLRNARWMRLTRYFSKKTVNVRPWERPFFEADERQLMPNSFIATAKPNSSDAIASVSERQLASSKTTPP